MTIDDCSVVRMCEDDLEMQNDVIVIYEITYLYLTLVLKYLPTHPQVM